LNLRLSKAKVMLPLSLGLGLLVAGVVVGSYLHERGHVLDSAAVQIARVEDSLGMHLGEDFKGISGALFAIEQGGSFLAPLRARDRETLHELAAPLFRRLQTQAEITHFYFSDPDRVNILRVHKPDTFGDVIDRLTTLEAQETGAPVQGIELGPLGTLTLRVVHPQIVDGECIGYIELGHEINHLIDLMGTALDVELGILVRKQYLDREGWETGMRMMGRDGDWDRLSDFVVCGGLPVGISANELRHLASEDLEIPPAGLELDLQGKDCRVGYFPLIDVRGQDLGRLFVVVDVSDREAASVRFVLSAALACVVAAGLLMTLFYLYLCRIEGRFEGEL